MDIDQLLTRGVAEVIVEAELRAKLKTGRKLRLKQGFDPTKPHMHIGHAVGLRKLRKSSPARCRPRIKRRPWQPAKNRKARYSRKSSRD